MDLDRATLEQWAAEDRANLLTVIGAVDRLNSWVRSPSYRHGCYGGAIRFVYDVKVECIRRGYQEGLIDSIRLIEVPLKCRDCGGTGRYDADGHGERDHCWACGNTGTAKLRFYETRFLELSLRWHTPRDRFPWLGIDNPAAPEPPGDWSPNQRGKDLTPSEAAELLLIAEGWYRQYGPHRRSIANEENLQYKLYVGNEPEDRCSLCDGPREFRLDYPEWREGSNLMVTRGRIAWTAHTCNACDAKQWATSSVWDGTRYVPNGPCRFAACPLPASLITPQIRRWIEARDAT